MRHEPENSRDDRRRSTRQHTENALCEIEAAGADREIGDHQKRQHAHERTRDPIQHLDGNHHARVGRDREQQRAQNCYR